MVCHSQLHSQRIRFCVSMVFALAILVCVGCGPGKKPRVARTGDENSTNQEDDGGFEKRRQVQAKVGVGKQGRLLKNREGLMATPGKAYFKARDKLTFMNAEKALQLFEGLNQRWPDSHDEYMEKVIDANNLTLPKLPEGDFYEYDVKKHMLMVWTADE